MAQHTITVDAAGEIDLAYQNATNGDGMPRLVSYKHVTQLTIPSLNGSAPTYQYRSHDPETGEWRPAYYHTSGPTLDEWYKQRQEAFNAAQEAQRDEWEAIKAEKRAKRFTRAMHKRDIAELESALMASLGSSELQNESRAMLDAAQAQAASDAAELEGILQAEYRDDYETRRDLRQWAVQ